MSYRLSRFDRQYVSTHHSHTLSGGDRKVQAHPPGARSAQQQVKLKLRAITNSDLYRDRAVMMSSTMPSAKYSCSGSPLLL